MTKYEFLEKYADVFGHTTKHYEFKNIDPLQVAEEIEEMLQNKIQECYLQCLVVECGEGECAEAIATKFPHFVNRLLDHTT